MSDLPKSIKVGPFRYRVDCTRASINEVVVATGKGSIGGCHHEKLLIAIDPDLPLDQKADTVLHEILHAVWYATACPKKAEEEDVIAHLTSVLLGVLRDNPALMAFLVSEDESDG